MAKGSNHVVLVPLPAQGHLLPILYLARKLAAHGFAVTIVNIDSVHESVKQNWRNVPQQDIRLESIQMELKVPKGFDAGNMDAVAAFVDSLQALEEPLADLLAKLSAARAASCVISDFYHPSAPHAASKAGIPSVCFWPGMASWASIQYSQPSMIAAGYIPVDGKVGSFFWSFFLSDFFSKLPESNASEIVDLPGLKPMRADDLPFYLRKDFYHKLGRDRFLRQLERAAKDTWVLANSFYELEPQAFDAMQHVVPGKFVPVGPLFPLRDREASGMEASLRPEDHSSIGWLDRKPLKSVLYVAFGSITVLRPGEFEELARGLEESGHPFLFSVPREMVPEVGDDRVGEFAERAARSGAGMVVRWAPQLAVLQHPSVGGFLSHCGWNSILESVSSGVPVLGWPIASEQNTNCKLALQERGVGMELADRSSGGVASAVRELMASEELRRNVAEIGRNARAAAAAGGSSHRNLHDFFHSCQDREILLQIKQQSLI
ncbi:7-deoxyloganetin glucosyltransferase [Selaginella moellendorffii]|nr:7-deoxyloganetin glucosyltransferase [Selaginella moellendorffii]|eukprot:XP_002972271.2 7-deoxyloganetin glucosyltransferase [Selaginella moellendorffii]